MHGRLRARRYRLLPAAADARAAFVFTGVAESGADHFGDNAAGLELDRADTSLGTPRHALRLAVADNLPHSYKRVAEEATHAHTATSGLTDPLIRVDMILYVFVAEAFVFLSVP